MLPGDTDHPDAVPWLASLVRRGLLRAGDHEQALANRRSAEGMLGPENRRKEKPVVEADRADAEAAVFADAEAPPPSEVAEKIVVSQLHGFETGTL